MRASVSRASFQWSRVISKSVNSGPGAASASVSFWSLLEKCSVAARTNQLGCRSSHFPHHGNPYANTARIRSPLSAWITASVWAGESWMCDQSRRVVIPASIAPSAETRLPTYASSGRNAGASLCRTNEM